MIVGAGLFTGVNAANAWNTLIPGTVTVPLAQMRLSVTGSPVLRSAFRMAVTLAVGAACRIKAQAPATCGAAIDVPLAIS